MREHSIQTVIQLFEQVVSRQFSDTALIFNNQSYSYGQLSQMVDNLASNLSQQSSKVIGLVLDRSVEMVAAVWAVLKSGCAYLPIDPTQPEQRIRFMLADCGVETIVTSKSYQAVYQDEFHTLVLDDNTIEPSKTVNECSAESHDLAYVMYTSGSTGTPKGVMIEHRSLLNYIVAMDEVYPLSRAERVMLKTPYNFDVSVRELIYTLAFGGTLVIAEPDGHKDPVYIARFMHQQQINVVHFVPSMLEVFLRHGGTEFSDSVNCVICSGEAITRYQVVEFCRVMPRVTLLNMYGPTEATVEVSCFDCRELGDRSVVPIGKPLANLDMVVLDETFNLCDGGQPGMLYIGGQSLARGYLNREDLTAHSFIDLELPGKAYNRWYQTGDEAKLLSDGNIVFLGRKDEQVSIRGHRIELSEIHNVLMSCEVVESGHVALMKMEDNQNKIVVYVCATQPIEEAELAAKILAHLQHALPDYMIPSHISLLDALPLNANGKIDKQALPKPHVVLSQDYSAPSNEVEHKIQQLWQDHLSINDDIGINENFFRLGGDSITLIKIVKGINDMFNLKLLFQQLNQNTTIEQQSLFVSQQLEQLAPSTGSTSVPEENVEVFEI